MPHWDAKRMSNNQKTKLLKFFSKLMVFNSKGNITKMIFTLLIVQNNS